MYCNAPSFLGYSPPGEGNVWQKAWTRLDEGYPCNPALETSTTSLSEEDNNGDTSSSSSSSSSSSFGMGSIVDIINTPRPTPRPTTLSETPSLVSGVVWYDANGDGRTNTALNALTQMEYDASQQERGAGVSNMRITLRQCDTDFLLGVTYTFPRTVKQGGSNIEIVDATYITNIQDQQQDNTVLGFNVADDGLGIGNTEGKLGYYSFRVLPNQIPGQFYVAFESPQDYRLTGGRGDAWEVYKGAEDIVQPVMTASWNEIGNSNANPDGTSGRRLQTMDEQGVDTNSMNEIISEEEGLILAVGEEEGDDGRPKQPTDPINYSGYFARSSCFTIQKSPSQVKNIYAGLTKDSWPLVPYQYASFVVTIKFYMPTELRRDRRRNRRRRKLVSLECRKYAKDKADGKNPEDLWNCEQGPSSGKNTISLADFKELTLEQGDKVALGVQAFFGSRVSRAWTVKLVSLAHQEMIVFEMDDDEDEDSRMRKLVDNVSSSRELQNKEIANLILGFRVRAEYRKSGENLSQILINSLTGGSENFLSQIKASIPSYFKLAGGVDVREVLWTPPEVNELSDDEYILDDDIFNRPTSSLGTTADDEGGVSTTGMVIGIVVALMIVLSAITMFLMYRHRHRKKRTGNERKKNKLLQIFANSAKRFRGDGYESDESSLSSRWYSDSSNFDPTTRMQDVDGYSDDDDSDSSSSDSSSSSDLDDDSSSSDSDEMSRRRMAMHELSMQGGAFRVKKGFRVVLDKSDYSQSKSRTSASRNQYSYRSQGSRSTRNTRSRNSASSRYSRSNNDESRSGAPSRSSRGGRGTARSRTSGRTGYSRSMPSEMSQSYGSELS